jgi:hypothetical protein
MWFETLRGKLAALVTLILVVCVGGTYFYIIEAQATSSSTRPRTRPRF